MAETSYIWTTGGGGDAGATVTLAHWETIQKITAGCSGYEGVSLWYMIGATVPAANTVRLSAGWAMVDGHPYWNSGNVDITIPSAVGAGNTRIDRIVLRAVAGATQTVRLTRVAGTDANPPTAPANPYTTSGSDYAILLYQVTVNTAGTVTITTDERVLAVPPAGYLPGNVITAASLTGAQLAAGANIAGSQLAPAAAIADGQLVNGKIKERQGGSATNWGVAGLTNYTPTTTKIYAGSIITDGTGDAAITFPAAFSFTPIVILTPVQPVNEPCEAHVVTFAADHCHIKTFIGAAFDEGPVNVFWMAIGPA